MRATDIAHAARLLGQMQSCMRELEVLLRNELASLKPFELAEPTPEFEIKAIQDATARYFGITVASLLKRSKSRLAVYRRAVAIHIARRAEFTLYDIASAFGLNHTTVMYALAAYASDEKLIAAASAITARLTEEGARLAQLPARKLPASGRVGRRVA